MDIDKELEDIFSDPLMDVSYQEAKLFDVPADMKGVMAQKKDAPDHVAQRKLCEDFAQFKPLFELVHQDLKTGKRQLQRISKTTSLLAGRYYLVDGQMVLLYEIIEKKKGTNGLPDGRTRCIYEMVRSRISISRHFARVWWQVVMPSPKLWRRRMLISSILRM